MGCISSEENQAKGSLDRQGVNGFIFKSLSLFLVQYLYLSCVTFFIFVVLCLTRTSNVICSFW